MSVSMRPLTLRFLVAPDQLFGSRYDGVTYINDYMVITVTSPLQMSNSGR